MIRTYPAGVPCWVNAEQPDPDAARRFYGELFGWTFSEDGTAALGGQSVAGIVPGPSAAWNTYVCVDDAGAVARLVADAGGTVVAQPVDIDGAGRAASCTDAEGASFRLWQPDRRYGAQVVNVPGAWNFSHLRTDRPDRARAFYADVFGWEALDAGGGAVMWRRPGYGDHLEATVDPGIRERQAHAPDGFADAVAGLVSPAGGAPHWYVVFTVADRDATADAARRLGGAVLATRETMWTREAAIRDPQGAELTLSQFAPPDDWD